MEIPDMRFGRVNPLPNDGGSENPLPVMAAAYFLVRRVDGDKRAMKIPGNTQMALHAEKDVRKLAYE